MFGNIESKGRPLRFLFLIKPNDKKALLEAIELNSVLWGGIYNPIIPLYTKKTKRWKQYTFRKTIKDITLGYINAFDPDFLVCDFETPTFIKELGLKIIKSSQIQPTKEEPYRMSFGVGIWDLLEWMYQSDFRFVQKFPTHLAIPIIPKKNRIFWSSWFGKLPDKFKKDLLSSYFKKAMDIKTPKVNELREILNHNTLIPRKIMQYGLTIQTRGGFSNENIVFFLDPSDFIDIIDFWNLRAVGRHVLPIPENLKDDNELKTIAKKYIESSKGTNRYNPARKYRANIIPSSSKSLDDTKKFIESLDLKKDEDGSYPVSFHQSYPRIWDDWARDKDSIDPYDVYFDSKSNDIGDNQNKITLPTVFPEHIENYYLGNPKIANEITFNIYGDIEKYAEVFPKSYGKEVSRYLNNMAGLNKWRIGRNGLVKLIDSISSSTWELPLSESIFSAWLIDKGWEYEVSTAGKLTKELYKQIDGWIYGFTNKDILDLFESMARSIDGEGRDKSIAYVKSRVEQITGNKLRMEQFLRMNLFSIGANSKCPNCQRSSWFELEKIKKEMACPKCLSSFNAIDSLGESNWSYKTVGPLSVPNHADGAISVMFSVDFFSSDSKMHSIKTTPVYSFNANKKSSTKQIEADFGFLWRESVFGEKSDGVAFGEAKTFNKFKRKDFQRMRLIGKEFPGAVLIFSTLREKLTNFEINEFKKLVKSGNKYWKNDKPINPIIILTSKELMSSSPPPYSWSEEDQKKYPHITGIFDLAKATQQKYLGVESWDSVWFEEIDKKRKAREEIKETKSSK